MAKLNPDARAAAVALRTITGRPDRSGSWLIIDERTGEVSAEVEARGGQTSAWWRWSGPWGDGVEGPPPGTYDHVFLRLPRSRPSAAYALERGAAVLRPGGQLWVAGGNDEGIKTLPKLLEPWYSSVESLDTKFHARLWWAERSAAPARDQLTDFLDPVTLQLPTGAAELRSGPGVFAKGQLDPGSKMLLEVLQKFAPRLDRVETALDVGCGIGVLSAGIRALFPDVAVTAVDFDSVAVGAMRLALPEVDGIVADGLGGLRGRPKFGLVMTNPPLHGATNTLEISLLERLIRQSATRMKGAGHLFLVVQRQRPMDVLLRDLFKNVKVEKQDGRYSVWHASHPHRRA